MRILVITRNAWDDSNAIGNTLTNFFEGIDDVEFANIYFRSASPKNNVCDIYFHTSETEVMKKWFFPKEIGKSFHVDKAEKLKIYKNSSRAEKKVIRFIQKHGMKFAYTISNIIWYSKKWQNNRLKKFIEEFSPDLVFTLVKSAPQYYLMVKYLRENFAVQI